MLNESTIWICDRCLEPILRPEDGLVEWIDSLVEGQPGARQRRGLRIVHNGDPSISRSAGGCPYQTHEAPNGTGFHHLDWMLGADGLMFLLDMLHLEFFADREQVLEMIKRLHIPLYEPNRNRLHEAYTNNVIELRGSERYPNQDELQTITAHYSSNNHEQNE